MIDGRWSARGASVTGLEVAPSALTLQVEDYWRSRLRSGRLPARRDIDPAELGRVLPFIFLLDVTGMPLRFRYRLVGTSIASREGSDPTGHWLDECLSDPDDSFMRFCQAVVRERRPICHAGTWTDREGATQLSARLLLPLAEDGHAVSMLLGAIDYAPGELVALRGAA